jgi:hypothetical protein
MTARLRRSSRLANCTLIARKAVRPVQKQGLGSRTVVLTWAVTVERVTGIEPALSAWESVQSGPSTGPDLRNRLSVNDRESPRFTRVNGPLMARRLDHVEGRPSANEC